MRTPLFGRCCILGDTASDHLELAKQFLNPGRKGDASSKNYASAECAKIVETNPEAKKASNIISEATDNYMLNPCKTKIWFVIELCEQIEATRIEMANYELFSSTPKDFSVYFSDVYPALEWKLIGQFTASDSRTLQAFDLKQFGFGKFIRVEMHSYYGNEHYCPISEVRVYGASMVEDWDNKLVELDQDIDKKKKDKKKTRKTSAHKVYQRVMTEPYRCGLIRPVDTTGVEIAKINHKNREQPILPQPTQQPVVNRTTPLKPSIFVELSNKVKNLEVSLKNQREDMERRLNETEVKFEKFTQEFKTLVTRLTALGLAYLVYNMFLNLML